MERAYVEKVRRGERPTREEADAFLRAWHARHPAATSRFRRTTASQGPGQSSYEILAACVPEGKDARVLDLACGEGQLAMLVHARLGPRGRVVGVDMSEGDVAIANERGLARAEFRCGLAQCLTEETASFDFVMCHYALMLVNPLAPVVREIARVLIPGGTFAAVVPGKWDAATFSVRFAALLDEVRLSELPGFALGLGDPEYHAHGAAHFFTEPAGFDPPIEITKMTLEKPEPPEGIWEGITNLYWFDLLRPAAQERLEREGMPLILAARQADGLVHFNQVLAQIRVNRSATPVRPARTGE